MPTAGKENRGEELVVLTIIAAALLVMLFPTVWMVMTAFKERSAVASSNLFNLGENFPTLANFYEIFARWGFLQKVINSFIIAFSTTLLATAIGAPAAYTFSRIRFKGRSMLLGYILSFRFLPAIAIVVPLFYLFSQFALIDTFQGVIMAYMIFTLPFVIWMLRGFFHEIPADLDEAAMVDGTTRFEALWKIVFPLARNGVLVTMLFSFIFAWNEFILALLLTRTRAVTVPVATQSFIGAFGMPIEWGLVAAATTFYLIPMLVVVAVLQKYIVRGLTLGAVKG